MAFRRQVKNFMKNYSDAEVKVREATSNDPWGPSSSLMLDISDLTFNTISLSEIMNMLWQRLSDQGKNWRHVYKSLTLMDYLIKNGSKKVIQHCREGFCNLQTLKDFQHVDEAGKDQGYYIREKSKQVITLLMDEQLLYKEREVACRTRRRTSYSMSFPKRPPGTGSSPTACASATTPDLPASEKKYKLLKVARLRSKKNASRAGLKQEQCPDTPPPSGAEPSPEARPLKVNAWKSTEDLIVFYEDEPKPLLLTVPPSIISSTTQLSEGEADVCNLWDAAPVPTASEKSLSLQTKVSSDKKSDIPIANSITEAPLQTPLGKESAAKCFGNLPVLPTLPALPTLWSSSREEHVSPNLRTSRSESSFYNQSSVETLYVSPSFKVVGPMNDLVINKGDRKPAEPSVVQLDDENLKAIATRVSAASEGTASFSTLSVSSPDSTSPEKSGHLLPPILARPSFWTLPKSSSASFKGRDKTAGGHRSCAPEAPALSDEEEDLSLLDILPDNSDSATKARQVSGSSWVEFPTENVDHFTSMSCSSVQGTRGLPQVPEANYSTNVLLGEVKNAIVKLHEDLSMVIRELNVINSHLVSMSGNNPQTGRALQSPLPAEGTQVECNRLHSHF
ncbi:PREDICTED: ENTH domain-containing protein 1 [Condylura cristata]|uniref:ENTH domain-containing protein 1 n=1 Tax=Condylura cristata TaxID=143302 RepID=UPI0003347BA1|nr:PREDICTED: ENTH domain-containing protein 1 [Condylura cristata]